MFDTIIEYYGIAQEFLANNTFQEYGVLGLFFNSLLSATAIPLPTEILTSALLMGGESELYVGIALILGSTIGGFMNYSIGFSGNKLMKYVNKLRFRKSHGLVSQIVADDQERRTKELETKDGKKSHKLLGKLGWVGIFIASWIPFFGDLMLISAGAKRMDFKKFTLFMVSGKIVKTVLVVTGLGAIFV